ncbi:hypothetical protein [Desulforhopalus sp. 52FAK]
MHMKISKTLLTVISAILVASTTVTAADKTISLLSDAGLSTIDVTKGNSFTVQLKVDDASEIAGASFTVTYDTDNITLNGVTSQFFGTFDDQAIDTPDTDAIGGYVAVDSVNYYSPLVLASATDNGSMLAAARFDNGSGIDETLFTLTFRATGSTGIYPISVSQSTINNVDAGYDEAGESIPFFVGIDNDTYLSYNDCTVNAVTVTVKIVDNDSDGIDDDWEIEYNPDGLGINDDGVLDYFTATGDYDNDGYSDYQEYVNAQNGETDPDGGSYNPTVENAPNGTGYVAKRIIPPGINLLLLN